MNWIYLVLAGIFEIGWPISMKLSQTTHSKALGLRIAIVSMSLSCFFLWLAQKTIPIGTAYAIWTGIGAVGTVTLGILFFGDSTNTWRLLSAFLIIVGIVGLRITN
jgi:quaternary ammonium compound-resistance protein SugE